MSGMDDWGWSDEPATERQASNAVLPEGEYVAQISAAKWDKKSPVPDKWRQKNPDGWRVSMTLTVHHEGKKYTVYADVPRHFQWLFEIVCDATRTDLPADADWSPHVWVGRDVEIETSIWQSNTGPKAQVEKWYPHDGGQLAPPKPAAKPAARTPAAKVKAAAAEAGHDVPNDDIPF